MAASTASTCLRSDGDSVHSQKRDQASGRERACDMAVTLAQPQGRTGRPRPAAPLPPLMEKFVIEGGVPLSGTVVPAGNKNAALPLLAACLLTDEEVVLHNVPRIRDTEAHARPARGPRRRGRARGDGQHRRAVRGGRAQRPRSTRRSPSASARRSSSPGPLLARFGEALLPPPGRRRDRPPAARPAPRRLPRARRARSSTAATSASRAPDGGLQACDFFMDEPSVMGTENALMAAALTPGTTVIRNAASEPHVQDLARMLIRMGAAIEGVGSNVMHVHGLARLGGCEHHVSPGPHRDRLLHGARRRDRRRAADQATACPRTCA